MRPWVACALHYGCMDFQNSHSLLNCTNESIEPHSCHRFDQSTIGILLTRHFNKKRTYLFFDCPISYRLWQFISNRFKLYFVNFVLNKENIFLGCKDESLLLNLLIILTKNYIYKCKLNEAKPNTIELKNKIKKYQSFDQYIAKKNNTVQAYEKCWAPIYIILN